MSQAELIQDNDNPQHYRVESIVDDGGIEVALFMGPNALERAIHFASGGTPGWYDEWADPLALAGR